MPLGYDYYSNRYGGQSIPEPRWDRLATKAEAKLERYTFGRLCEPFPENAKNAICEMAETINKHEKKDGKSSESNDGYSVSYEASPPLGEELYSIASNYLLHTGMMDLEV